MDNKFFFNKNLRFLNSSALNLPLIETLSAHIVQKARLVSKKRKVGNRERDRGYALREVEALSEENFMKMFRMNRAGFALLLEKVAPFIKDTDEAMAKVSSKSCITKATKLYCTLRWLAGGSYIDICFAWGIAKGSFFSTDCGGVLWPTIEAIDYAFDIGLSTDTDSLKKMADDFCVYSHGELYGCVTAIDGWVAKTRKPLHSEVDDVMAYRNRHGCWGLVVLAGCDAHCKFTMFSCKNSGSTNDTIAWDASLLKQEIDKGNLPPEYFIIGDEAFNCSNQLLVPYGGRSLGIWKDSFNFHLSVMRQCIERSFALLTQRWGVLWRPLRCDFCRWTLVLTACAKLHNFCINADIPISNNRFYEDRMDGDVLEVLLNENQDEVAEVARSFPSNRRANFTRELELKGIRRPLYAAMNSRA
jgi:hypothetical protein